MRVAAIGIGSNSLRMLIADVERGRLFRLDRYREGLRVFAALDRQGNITPEMTGKACRSVEAFRRQAVECGAERVHLFATSAVRDAANQEAFSKALLDATGLSLEICSGDLEARLSFIGATDGETSGLMTSAAGPRKSPWAVESKFKGRSACRWEPCACAASIPFKARRRRMPWCAPHAS